VQDANTRNTFKDVGVTDYNALMARVLGFEDATTMMTNGEIQAELTRTSARMQAQQYNVAADSSVRTAGLLANAKLTEGITDFAKTFKW
jgi:hypothetical protein